MKAYRYNSKNREDRKFNQTGREKNPNNVKFYATNMNYADGYKYIYTQDGDVWYECELEIVYVDANLFDMPSNFSSLATFRTFIDSKISEQRNDYQRFLVNAKDAKSRAMWERNIAELDNREAELVASLQMNEFQSLSDFNFQDLLIAEIKSLGFDGYVTKNEIAIF